MSEILSSVEVDTFDGAPVNLLEQRKGADISGSTVAAQWFIIGRGQSSCPPHNPPKYRPEKDPKVTKNIFSLILLVHSSFVSRGKTGQGFYNVYLVVGTVVAVMVLFTVSRCVGFES